MAHRVGGTNQVAERVLTADFLPQDAVFALDMEFFYRALEEVPQNVVVDGLDKIVVGAGIDHFQGRGFPCVRAENDYERINFAAVEAAEQLGAFPHAPGCHGHGQQQYVEFFLFQEPVGRFVVFAFEHFKVRAQRGGDLRPQGRIIVHNGNLWFRRSGRYGVSPAGDRTKFVGDE